MQVPYTYHSAPPHIVQTGLMPASGADVGAKDHDEVTALMNAAESGSLEAVEALLAKGADPGSMSTTAFTPLIVAAAGGHLAVVKVGGWGARGGCV